MCMCMCFVGVTNVQLCTQFPRLWFPIYRLQTSIQKHNMGEKFWDNKKEAFVKSRQAIGVEKKRTRA